MRCGDFVAASRLHGRRSRSLSMMVCAFKEELIRLVYVQI